ncbi:MAG: rhomboid family intramembrane serine protease [Verrucomicrobiota bacterium]
MLEDRSYMRQSPYQSRWSASLVLVVANTVVFGLQLITPLISNAGDAFIKRYLELSPAGLAGGYVWQLLTFQFLHGGPLHLILNCAMLWIFGRPIEDTLGKKTFLKLYFLSGTLGGFAQVGCSWLFPAHFGYGSVVGASAGIFGLIAAFAALNWERPITTLVAFIIPVTMKAKYLILIFAIIGILGLLNPHDHYAHGAHLAGLATGLAYIRFLVQSERSLFTWKRSRASTTRRELVEARSSRQAFWKRPIKSVPDDLPPSEFISKEVDPILDKISAHGIQSLTPHERQILEAARAKMGKR